MRQDLTPSGNDIQLRLWLMFFFARIEGAARILQSLWHHNSQRQKRKGYAAEIGGGLDRTDGLTRWFCPDVHGLFEAPEINSPFHCGLVVDSGAIAVGSSNNSQNHIRSAALGS